MTEEEAKEKWCPMAGQRPLAEHEKCVASECMIWRWNTAGFKYCDGDRVDVPSKTTGYCGLGDKP